MSPRAVDELPATDAEIPSLLEELGIPGIVDVHVHALPDRLQRAVWRYFDALDDPPWPVHYRGTLDERLGRLRELGVVAHTALAYPHRAGMLRWLNDFTLGLATEHAQVVPTFTLYPEDGVSEEVARCVERGGRVVKVHLQVGRFHASDPRLDEAWSLIETAGIPVVLHASAVYGVDGGGEYCGADEVAELLETHPGLRLVVAHLGMPSTEDFVRLAEQAPTLRLDTSMALTDPPYAGMVFPEEVLERLGGIHDQLLFGSDYPSIPRTYAAQIRGLAALGLGDGELAQLLYHRGRELLGVGTPGAGSPNPAASPRRPA